MFASGVRLRFLTLLCAFFLALTSIRAQSAPLPSGQGSDWSRVQALPAGTSIRVAQRLGRAKVYSFEAADDVSLRCTRTRRLLFFPLTVRLVFARTNIASVKYSRGMLSGVAGAGIGAAVGAGVGAGLESQYTGPSEGLPLIFALFGVLFGFVVGSATDFLAGPTIFRAP